MMQQMQVQATVPGGEMMTVNVNGQEMAVQVPAGVQPGQAFTFQAPMQQPVMAVASPVMAQPMMAQPGVMMGTPVQPVQPMQPVVAMGASMEMATYAPPALPSGLSHDDVPPGAPPGGFWTQDAYCGATTCVATILVALIFWPAVCCVPCCKCDRMAVYQAPDGRRFVPDGRLAPPADSCC